MEMMPVAECVDPANEKETIVLISVAILMPPSPLSKGAFGGILSRIIDIE